MTLLTPVRVQGSRIAAPPAENRLPSPQLPQDAADRGTPPTYYDQPALKPSPWGWKVSAYMFVSGLAGSAQIIATAAEMVGGPRHQPVVRYGRYLAFAGTVIGAPLLIADLHTPQRFYNMLRIFRLTSPMSIGTYLLVGFGVLSSGLAVVQLRRDLAREPAPAPVASRLLQAPAAMIGASMSTYTGALLGATSTPLWAAAPRLVPALFGASAMASGSAALSLMCDTARHTLGPIEALASAVELYLLAAMRRRLRREGVRTRVAMLPVALLAAAPILHQLAAMVELPQNRSAPPDPVRTKRSAMFGTASAIAVLAGAFLLRHAILRAGNRSAQRPRDHFRLARPR